MTEAARTSETLVNFYQTTRRYNPDDSHLRKYSCLVSKDGGVQFVEWLWSYYLDVLHADSDSDIDCSDDESEQETVINDDIHVENASAN
jgi:hypothetical protein